MTDLTPLALLSNGASLPWGEVPSFPVHELVDVLAADLERGGRLCSFFGVPADSGTELVAVVAFDADSLLAIGRSQSFQGAFPSLTPRHPQAHLFEREIAEQCGVTPEGHPWLKPVRRTEERAPFNAPFFRVEGGEVHEVAVGPVHAGIIEPGHFRFQCAGEDVISLEIALGYQHRGIERALLGGPHRATLIQVEAIAGDASIAHTTAYATLLESLAGTEAPLRAQWLRAVALELERLANHTGDIGALANDVAFLPTSAACGKIRGDFLNLTAMLCGNRFGRSLVVPGGCRRDVDDATLTSMAERLRKALADTDEAVDWFWAASSVRGRFERTGIVSTAQASDIGMVGPAARASGLVRDVRFDHPAGWHRFAQLPVAVWPDGDVFGRARVRSLDLQRSGAYLEDQLQSPVDSELRTELSALRPERLAVSLVESWRGEVCHVALTDHQGRFAAYKITDASFHNWFGLALAMRGTAISDFPICNKSFSLSYCGADL